MRHAILTFLSGSIPGTGGFHWKVERINIPFGEIIETIESILIEHRYLFGAILLALIVWSVCFRRSRN
ncbi:MAG: hypothetical protein JXR73_23115 [Candidatus Omnitrophica bacterium]|nr:hypothetical protein [Candidatus Omnitrophota bacterium]